MTARPFLKYAGGKTALLPEILPRLPEHIHHYYEPFLGGGAVFFALAEAKRFSVAYLSDANMDLMSLYEVLAHQPDDVIRKLKTHIHDEKYYYEVRAQNPSRLGLGLVSAAARLIFLNRTCFNGLYRVNKSGQFNVPFGSCKNPTICDEENLRAAALVLCDAAISSIDFEDAVRYAKRGDAVYFDPPYIPLSGTSNFTAYSAGGFTDGDQERLRNTMDRLDAKGVHVLLSNSDTPRARELYADFKIEEVQAPRRVNSKGGKRGNVGELLISGKSQ